MELELEDADSNEATGTDASVSDTTFSDTSASQRLAPLRALNNGSAPTGAPSTPEPAESIVMSSGPPGDGVAARATTAPETSEQQMNTSMTQTLKALSARDIRADQDDET